MSSKSRTNKHKHSVKNNNTQTNTRIGLQKKIVSTFLCMINTVKLYHWSTSHYATHKATDQLYSELSSKIDTFVETMFGKETTQFREEALKMRTIKINSLQTNKEFRNETEQYKSFLVNLDNNKLFNSQKNTDLLSLRDDILVSLNQFLYLLTLK